MNFELLNKYAIEYVACRNNDTFAPLYNEAMCLFQVSNRYKLRSLGCGDGFDADSIFNDVILSLAQRDDIQEFGRMLAVSLRKARLSFARKEGRRRKRVSFSLDEPLDVEGRLFCVPIVDDNPIHKKKEAEQCELLQFIIKKSGDEVAQAIEEANKTLTTRFSVNAICGMIGVHHMTGERALKRLARYYDVNIHGDITDYLPDGVRVARKYLSA
ncbi:hypothetical protein [Paenibacillus sp. KN14-4R]|uniref:hypothetical protein n=1 Tax=Paenibacillus sp. KN14-4R TaxID=3445773 RepID=UPI003F9EDF7A